MKEDIYQESLRLHAKKKGKLEIRSKVSIKTRKDLSLAYTPGVGQVCKEIAKDKNLAYKYTIKSNTVAIITDGSAVLGLGNIGGTASIPVMEGKAILFKEFAGIDAFPICFEGHITDFVQDIKNISPIFGGINLEDIAAPACFEIEEKLQDLGIPVMHDDQHGTAIVVLAALLNSLKVTKKKVEDITIVINGAGAAGIAIAKLLGCIGDEKSCIEPKDILVCDRKGIIYQDRPDLKGNRYKEDISRRTNKRKRKGELVDALKGADIFIGVSAPGVLTEKMIKSMNPDPIIFAMANPIPEIMPDKAKKAGAMIVGTGRSDFPNQINNVLAFPGIFRGALDSCATTITSKMKVRAAYALANYIKKPTKNKILPSVLDKNVTKEVAKEVAKAVEKEAKNSGCCRHIS